MRSVRALSIAAAIALPHLALAVRPLAYDLRLDIPITLVAGAGWIGTEYGFKSKLAPASCRWCDRDTGGTDTLNPIDAAGRSVRWGSLETADMLSNLDAFAVMPAALFGLDAFAAHRDGAIEAFPVDAMILVEVVAVQSAVNQIVKFLVGRERPFVHVLSPDEKLSVPRPTDNNLSFYSGHTSMAFALAVAAGMVARLRGYRTEPLIWAVGIPLAASVGYLRMAADRHYAVDVFVGAAVGAAFGFIIPLFHGPLETGPIGFSATTQGLSIHVPFG